MLDLNRGAHLHSEEGPEVHEAVPAGSTDLQEPTVHANTTRSHVPGAMLGCLPVRLLVMFACQRPEVEHNMYDCDAPPPYVRKNALHVTSEHAFGFAYFQPWGPNVGSQPRGPPSQ